MGPWFQRACGGYEVVGLMGLPNGMLNRVLVNVHKHVCKNSDEIAFTTMFKFIQAILGWEYTFKPKIRWC